MHLVFAECPFKQDVSHKKIEAQVKIEHSDEEIQRKTKCNTKTIEI